MEKQQGKKLLEKLRNGTITEQERLDLDRWYLHYSKTAAPFTDMDAYLKTRAALDHTFSFDEVKTASAYKLWPRIIGVAAAVAAITLGVWLYYTNEVASSRKASRNDGMVVNDIAPGKNTATIKIGDGEAITLSDKQTGVIVGDDNLTYTDGSTILSSRANAKDLLNSTNKRSLPYGRDDGRARMLTVTTPRGGTYQVTLPDGTKVWLNAASVLTYTMPLNERGGVRLVELSGEAYFEVFRNKNQPFVVSTKNLTTTVLGTHFNISAYDDEESTKATLLEGSVRVVSLAPLGRGGVAGEGNVVLKPNQQASVTSASAIAVKEVDAEELIAWKNNLFSFNSEDMASIMRKVARWYDIEVVYKNDVRDVVVSGAVPRFSKLSILLEKLQQTDAVHFKIEDRKIIVSK